MSQQMTGAQALVAALESAGVDTVFGIPGGAILPAYDPLFDSRQIRHVLVRHEQGAGHAASGYAYATGRVGVCMATSGPGATNLVTGIANAFLDSVPVVAITGQVPTGLMGTDAFQEVDIFGMTMPIVKHSFLVRRVEDIASTIGEAFRIASEGRPGPVLVDLPKDGGEATDVDVTSAASRLREAGGRVFVAGGLTADTVGAAVAAALAALSPFTASATGFTDRGQDIVPTTETRYELHGAFRLRSEMLYNLDLDRGPTPSGQLLTPTRTLANLSDFRALPMDSTPA